MLRAERADPWAVSPLLATCETQETAQGVRGKSPQSPDAHPAGPCPPSALLTFVRCCPSFPLPQRPGLALVQLGRVLIFKCGCQPPCSGYKISQTAALGRCHPHRPSQHRGGLGWCRKPWRQPTPEENSVRWFLEIETRLSFLKHFLSLTTLCTGRVFWVEDWPAEGSCRWEALGQPSVVVSGR